MFSRSDKKKKPRPNSAAPPSHRELFTQRISRFSDSRFLCCHLVKIKDVITPRKITLFKYKGAFHYAKDSGNFGRNSNGKVRFGFFRPEYSGSPLEVVHLFRLEYSDRNSPFHF